MNLPSGASRRCFLISPIGEEGSDDRRIADQVQRHLVRRVLEPHGFEVIRADQDNDPGAITPRVLSLIQQADLVIADLSTLNPNVFYEVGIAHTLGKEVILITQSIDDVPFDLRHLRCIPYQYTPRGIEVFEQDLKKTLLHIMNR